MKKTNLKPNSKDCKWFIYIPFALLLLLSVIRLQYPEISHGDDWGDANTLNAGENMARLGFGISHGLPINYPVARELPPVINPYESKDPLNNFGTYTRVPPLTTIFNAILRKFGFQNMSDFRFAAISLSFLSAVFFYLFLKNWFGSQDIAALGTLFFICNPFFIANMDGINFPLNDTIAIASLYFLTGLQSCTAKKFYQRYACIFVLFLLLVFTAYEYTLFLSAFVLFWVFVHRRQVDRFKLVLVLLLPTAFVFSFLFHLSLIAAHIGSFQEAFHGRITHAIARASGEKMHLGSQHFNWVDWFSAVGIRFPLQVLFFPFLLIVIGMVAAFAFKTGEKKPTLLQKSLLLALALGAGGFAWYVVMPAHSLDHAGLTFLQRHLVPAVAVIFGGILATYILQLVHSGWKPANAQMAVWALALAGGITAILGSELPVAREKIESEQEFEKIVTSLRQVAPKVAYEDYVGMNVFRPTNAFTYYLKARTLHIPTAMAFEALEKKPSVFLLVPINDPETQKLADLLSQNYKVAFIADNKRLPFYVFIKNNDKVIGL